VCCTSIILRKRHFTYRWHSSTCTSVQGMQGEHWASRRRELIGLALTSCAPILDRPHNFTHVETRTIAPTLPVYHQNDHLVAYRHGGYPPQPQAGQHSQLLLQEAPQPDPTTSGSTSVSLSNGKLARD
jgi:hypothetical protein